MGKRQPWCFGGVFKGQARGTPVQIRHKTCSRFTQQGRNSLAWKPQTASGGHNGHKVAAISSVIAPQAMMFGVNV
ncbi:hypothetical protein ASY01nite_04200 [Acetobacter syzygii]|nr:hypothetical protein Absy_027_054 [Acetobacter syzygii]GBR64023.1 hypothetical protein AA0483_1164 [Acetobacter syzygii NRIC 0483]GEL55354.1 hypothetical protein ASY01nite_04200 [Acetobacter syzygii]